MSIAYPLRVFLDCSTAHLSPSARAFIESGEPFASATPYGWFVWANEEADEKVPIDLAAIMAHARKRGAEYILFDCDAEEIATLPTFEWSG